MTTTQQLPGGLSYFPRGSQAWVNALTTRDAHRQPLEPQLLHTRSRTKGVTRLPNQSPLAQLAACLPRHGLATGKRVAAHSVKVNACGTRYLLHKAGALPAAGCQWPGTQAFEEAERPPFRRQVAGGSSRSPSHPLLAETGEKPPRELLTSARLFLEAGGTETARPNAEHGVF